MKKPNDATVFKVVALTAWLVCAALAVLLLQGCSSTPAPARYHFERPHVYEHVGFLPVEEGDEVLVEVPVGTLRNALYIAEAYEALLPIVNQRGDTIYSFAIQIEQQQDALKAAELFMWVGAGAGVAGGFLLGALLWAR